MKKLLVTVLVLGALGFMAYGIWYVWVTYVPKPVDYWVEKLKDPDPSVRVQASATLASQDPDRLERVLPALVEAMRDSEPQVRANIALALGIKKDPRPLEPLTTALRDRDMRVRQNAVKSLGVLGNRAAVPPLMEVVRNDPKWLVRSEAAKALGEITHAPVGPKPEDWQKWWDEHSSDFGR
jgi:HEAT repeat protein